MADAPGSDDPFLQPQQQYTAQQLASLVAPPPGSDSFAMQNSAAGGGMAGSDLYPYAMSAPAQQSIANQPPMPFGLSPYNIAYNPGESPSGFTVGTSGGAGGTDLFGGRVSNLNPSQIPQQLQPYLAPALVRYYQGLMGGGSKDARTVALNQGAGWTGRYAPPVTQYPANESRWSGSTFLDPWGREQGQPGWGLAAG